MLKKISWRRLREAIASGILPDSRLRLMSTWTEKVMEEIESGILPDNLSVPKKSQLVTARVSHKTRNPRKNKGSSKLGFGGILKVSQKVGLEVGFTVQAKRKTYFQTYFFDLLWEFPRNLLLSCFWATEIFFGDFWCCGSLGPWQLAIAETNPCDFKEIAKCDMIPPPHRKCCCRNRRRIARKSQKNR